MTARRTGVCSPTTTATCPGSTSSICGASTGCRATRPSISLERHGISLAKGTLSEGDAFAHLSNGIRFAAASQRNLQAHLVVDPYGVERVAGFTVNS